MGLSREISDVQTPRPVKVRTGTVSCGMLGNRRATEVKMERRSPCDWEQVRAGTGKAGTGDRR